MNLVDAKIAELQKDVIHKTDLNGCLDAIAGGRWKLAGGSGSYLVDLHT